MPRPPDDTSEVVPSAIRVYRHLPVFGFIVSPLSLVFSVFGLASTSFEDPPGILARRGLGVVGTGTGLGPLFARQANPNSTSISQIATTTVSQWTVSSVVATVAATVTTIALPSPLPSAPTPTPPPAYIPPPPKPFIAWLLSSLACAAGIIAVYFLYIRMRGSSSSSSRDGKRWFGKHLPVARSTAYALLGLACVALSSLGLCMLYSIQHPLQRDWEYSEGFYNTAEGGILAVVGIVFLGLDWIWTGDAFNDAGSGLSKVQARVVLSLVGAVTYSALLSLVFALIERWSYRDAMFFSLTTLTTIGFGSPKSPKQPLSRMFVILAAGVGIGLVALSVKSIADALDEGLREGVMLRYRRMKRRGGEQVGYEELSGVGPEDEVDGHKWGVGGRILDLFERGWDSVVGLLKKLGRRRRGGGKEEGGNREVDDGTTSTDVEMAMAGTASAVVATDGTTNNGIAIPPKPPTTSTSTTEPSIETFLPNFRRRFFSSLLALLLFWTLSSVLFYLTERDQSWSYLDSVYFTFVAFTTIGYGDLYPQSSSGLAVFNIFVFVGIAVMTYFASTMALWVRSTHDPEGFMREVVRMQEEEEARMRSGKGGETPGGGDDDEDEEDGDDEDGEEGQFEGGDQGALVDGAAKLARTRNAAAVASKRTVALALGSVRGLPASAARDAAIASLEGYLKDLESPRRAGGGTGKGTPQQGQSLVSTPVLGSRGLPPTSSTPGRTVVAPSPRPASPTEYPTLMRPPTSTSASGMGTPSTNSPVKLATTGQPGPVSRSSSAPQQSKSMDLPPFHATESDMGEFQGPVSPKTAELLAMQLELERGAPLEDPFGDDNVGGEEEESEVARLAGSVEGEERSGMLLLSSRGSGELAGDVD